MSRWTGRRVKEEMVRAFEVLEATTGKVGPDWFKNNWPEYHVEFSDEVNQRAQGTVKTTTKVRVQWTAKEISAMERVLLGYRQQPNWGSYVVRQPAAMRTLVLWCFWEIRGRHTEVECERRGLAYSTFRRRRDLAADMIAGSLNADGISAW